MKRDNYKADEAMDFEDDNKEESSFSIKDFIGKVLMLWPWLIISALFFTVLAYLYLRYASPQYKIHATLLVQDEKKGSGLLAAASAIQDLGGIGGKSNVDNEALVIKSRTPMEKTVRELQLFTSYYDNGTVKKRELYNDRPILLLFNIVSKKISPSNSLYEVHLNKAANTFIISNKEKIYNGHLGDSVKLEEGTAMVENGPGFDSWQEKNPFFLKISDFKKTVANYMEALSTDLPNKQTSLINLTLTDRIPERGETVLNELISQYLNESLEDKNRIADSTVNFIDERLVLVSKELNSIEKNIENFKKTNRLTDVAEQSKILVKSASDNMAKETDLNVELSVVQELESFLNNNINERSIVPSNLLITDPNFTSLVRSYNDLQILRDRRLLSQTEDNPAIKNMDGQLHNLRQNLISSIASIKRGIEISIAQLGKYTSKFDAQISSVPGKERQGLDMSREQAIKQELYIFLLTRREETAISKASSLATTRIVDNAMAEDDPFKPQRSIVLAVGLVIGLMLPFAFIYGRDLLNNRVSSIADINKLTKVPVLAEIGHNSTGEVFAVTHNSRTEIAERFRVLRTHLQYLLPNASDKTILFTSSMSGEGKSFLSINLAQTLALAHKKVLLMEMDLRKPKIRENLGLKKLGFSNYITSNNTSWKKYIQHAGEANSFDVFTSGPVPPNPAELLLLPKMKTLMQELQAEYDYVIIDTAPIGLVTDAEILALYANLSLYVVRHNFTFKQRLHILDDILKRKSLPKLNILINDIKYTKKGYGGYYNGYGYYGSDGYASENVEEQVNKGS